MKKFKNRFPGVNLRGNMNYLGTFVYLGIGLEADELKNILEKCQQEEFN